MNVLLDANVWISAFLNPFGYPAQLRTAWLKDQFAAVVSPALLGRAEYLVSRDDDLKRDVELIEAMEQEGIRILSVQQFIRHLK